MRKRRLAFGSLFGDVVILAAMGVVTYALFTGAIIGEIYGSMTHQSVSLLIRGVLGVVFTTIVFGALFAWMKWDERRSAKRKEMAP